MNEVAHPAESQITDAFGVNRTKVPFPEPIHWCVVNYYELNTRLGVPYEATSVSKLLYFQKLYKRLISFIWSQNFEPDQTTIYSKPEVFDFSYEL